MIVDAGDYEALKQFVELHSLRGYAYGRRENERSIVSIARFLLGISKGDDRVADHINGDTLDNRRCNLRIATHSQNIMNADVHKNNKVRLKGVCLEKGAKTPTYIAQGRYKGRVAHLGNFHTPEAAHFMYCWFARQHYGGFHREGSLRFDEGSASVNFSEDNGETKIEMRFRAGANVSDDLPRIIAAMTRLTIKCPKDYATITQ
jgi:hypothetical protein